jgi:hypothetical protein
LERVVKVNVKMKMKVKLKGRGMVEVLEGICNIVK